MTFWWWAKQVATGVWLLMQAAWAVFVCAMYLAWLLGYVRIEWVW